jgi:hypothetical protein
MEEGQKPTEPQQENESTPDIVTSTKVAGDNPEEPSPQATIVANQKNGEGIRQEDKGDGDNNGVESPKEEMQPAEEKNDDGEPMAEEKPESKNGVNLEEDKGNGVKPDDVIKRLKNHKCTLDCDRCCNTIKYLFLILLCFGGVVVLTLVMFGVWEMQLNVYSTVLIYGLMLLLIVATVVLSYMLTISNRRYSAAITRLDLLITRIVFMNNNSKLLMDVDRELQLIARLLESSNNIKL